MKFELQAKDAILTKIASTTSPIDLIAPASYLAKIKKDVEDKKKEFKAQIKELEAPLKEAEAYLVEIEEAIKAQVLSTLSTYNTVKVNNETGEVKEKLLNNLGSKTFTYTPAKTTKTVNREILLEKNLFTKTITVIDEDALAAHIELLGLGGLPVVVSETPERIGLQ